jgi:nucleoside-diphosphate-sugar epimerase
VLGVEQVQGDLVNPGLVEKACAGCGIVFHVAAKAGIAGRWHSYYTSNVLGTRNIVAACRKVGVRRIVYTSSPSVVFHGGDMEGVDESVPYPRHYDAHYPRSKAMAEREILAANGTTLSTVALRPHLIWGPGDNHLVPRILARGRAGRLRRIGNGSKRIDSTYIDNAAQAHLQAADRLPNVGGKVYFISNGEPMPTWDLVNRILAAGGLPAVNRSVPAGLARGIGAVLEVVYGMFWPEQEPPMTRFVARELATAHWFDISAARRELAYEPGVSIEEGLRRLAEWLRTQHRAQVAVV